MPSENSSLVVDRCLALPDRGLAHHVHFLAIKLERQGSSRTPRSLWRSKMSVVVCVYNNQQHFAYFASDSSGDIWDCFWVP
jgi:hypothetical protein